MTAMYMRYTMIVWRKKVGPMIGMSDRIGMLIRSNRGGEFRSAAFGARTWENRKLVNPTTSTFSTTPTMTWSTKYLIANAASTNDTSTPATAAASSPRYGLPVADATIAEVKAPASSCPSMAMLITPTRSEITPDSEPKISGTD